MLLAVAFVVQDNVLDRCYCAEGIYPAPETFGGIHDNERVETDP